MLVVIAGCGGDGTPRAAPEPPAHTPARPPPSTIDRRGLLVTATDVLLDGASLGIAPASLAADRSALSEQLRRAPAAVALRYTGDAPAAAVVAALCGLIETGHPRVDLATELAGKAIATCSVTAAPAESTALKVELRGDRVELGLSDVRPVLHRALRDSGLAAELREDLAAPFFDQLGAAEIAVDPAAVGSDLHRVMNALCGKLTAWRVGDFEAIESARRQPGTLPQCRKVIVRSPERGHDPDTLRTALPELDAMDLCYRRFARAPGPAGTVTMTLEIQPDGTVGAAAATGLEPEVNRCIAWLVARGRLAPPPAAVIHVRATAECNTRCCNGD